MILQARRKIYGICNKRVIFTAVVLRNISEENRGEIIALKVAENQREYIASNEDSLREAEYNPGVARAFGIYSGDRAVGFAMFAFDEENDDPHDRFWLWRFMIDESLQGQGFGRAALTEIIKYFRENGADEITLSTKESNRNALALYYSFGFEENGDMNDGETVLKLKL